MTTAVTVVLLAGLAVNAGIMLAEWRSSRPVVHRKTYR